MIATAADDQLRLNNSAPYPPLSRPPGQFDEEATDIGIDASELISRAARWLAQRPQHAQELRSLTGEMQALLLPDHIDPADAAPSDGDQR